MLRHTRAADAITSRSVVSHVRINGMRAAIEISGRSAAAISLQAWTRPSIGAVAHERRQNIIACQDAVSHASGIYDIIGHELTLHGACHWHAADGDADARLRRRCIEEPAEPSLFYRCARDDIFMGHFFSPPRAIDGGPMKLRRHRASYRSDYRLSREACQK